MLLAALSGEAEEDVESAGLALVAADKSITQADAAAEMWLAELRENSRGEALPPVVTAVASRARSIGAASWRRRERPRAGAHRVGPLAARPRLDAG